MKDHAEYVKSVRRSPDRYGHVQSKVKRCLAVRKSVNRRSRKQRQQELYGVGGSVQPYEGSMGQSASRSRGSRSRGSRSSHQYIIAVEDASPKHNFRPSNSAKRESEERPVVIDCKVSLHDSPMKPRPDDSVHKSTSVSPFKQQRRPGGFNPSESDFNDRAFVGLQHYEGAESRGNTDERQHEDSVLV